MKEPIVQTESLRKFTFLRVTHVDNSQVNIYYESPQIPVVIFVEKIKVEVWIDNNKKFTPLYIELLSGLGCLEFWSWN